MRRPFPASLILLAAALGADHGVAQSAPPPLPAAEVATPSVPTATDPAPARARPVSPQAAALLGVIVPKHIPPALADAKSPEEAPDLRETDRPRNTIIRLPKYLVQEDRPPVFRERDILTAAAKINLMMKRNPGLRYVPLWQLNRGIALFMYQEQQRLDDIAETTELARLISFSDPAAGQKAQSQVQEMFMRWADLTWHSSR
jgi:hypothetical protein